MKKIINIIIGILLTTTVWAQAPQSFNYQAVLRDNAGEVLADENVEIAISILFGNPNGLSIYTESHDTQTNAFGLVSLQIGEGNSSDALSSINWTNGPYFIQVEVDGTEMGTTQLLSVPYALYAEKAGNAFSGSFNDLTDVPEIPDPANAFSGSFDDLTNIPENLDTDVTDDFSGSFKDLTDIPIAFDTLNNFTGSFNDLTDIPENLDTDASDDFSGDYNDLTNKPNIPEGVEQVFSENDEVAFITDKKVGIGTETARGSMEVLDGGVLFAGETGSVEISGPGTRLMWIPEKAALRAGKVDGEQWDMASIGPSSTALGTKTIASELNSFASGGQTIASGPHSTAMGFQAKAIGNTSIAMGGQTEAQGVASVAMGIGTKALESSSTAMGRNTIADGENATAMGNETKAIGNESTAMGNETKAIGNGSTAIGVFTEASGSRAIAMGSNTIANGTTSTAMGNNTEASGQFSTAMGSGTVASGVLSTAMGKETKAMGENATAIGTSALANKLNATAIGYFSQALGIRSVAIGSHARANTQGSVVISASKDDNAVAATQEEQMVLRAGSTFFLTDKGQAASPPPTGAFLYTSTGAWLSNSGAWGNSSDRNLKENFTPIDTESLIKKIKALEVTTWNYKKEGEDITRIGPMAQDFYRIYGFGADDKSISTVDGIGVALATIKALVARNEMLESRLETLENKIEQFLSTVPVNVRTERED